MVQRHEECVHDNAQRDEEFDERIEHNQRDVFLQLQPQPATVPHAENVDDLQQPFEELLLERGLVFFVLVVR